jgi:hypothetical protein
MHCWIDNSTVNRENMLCCSICNSFNLCRVVLSSLFSTSSMRRRSFGQSQAKQQSIIEFGNRYERTIASNIIE